jgi:hypothetical protein
LESSFNKYFGVSSDLDFGGVTWPDGIEKVSPSDGESVFVAERTNDSSLFSVDSAFNSGGVSGLVGVTEGEDMESLILTRPFSMNILLKKIVLSNKLQVIKNSFEKKFNLLSTRIDRCDNHDTLFKTSQELVYSVIMIIWLQK